MDGNLNVVLENVTLWDSVEQAQKQTTSKNGSSNETFSDVFIRGNNVCYITPSTDGKTAGEGSSSSSSGSSGSSSDSEPSPDKAKGEVMMTGQE